METTKPSHPSADSDSATDRLREQSRHVRADLQDLGRLAKDATQEKLGEARQAAAQYYEKGTDKATDLERQLTDYVRRYPLRSLGIAAGVGALLGLLVRRR